MANENIDIITLENIELFQNGERANATNLNRPIVQLRDNQIDQNLMLAQIYNVLSSNNLNLDELQEIVDGLTSKADKVDTYNKTEVDNELILKADKLDTYNKTEIDTELILKADKTEVELLKSQINNITREEFIATQDQVDFVMQKDLVLPVLICGGSIQSSDTYTFTGTVLTLNTGANEGEIIQIINLR